MTLDIFTDGGSKGNPGPAAIGIAFYINGKRVKTYREDIGYATNNDAEYTAVIRAYEIFQKTRDEWNSVNKLSFHSDSQLIVRQINGLYKLKHPQMKKYVEKIKLLETETGLPVSYTNIPREKNQVADSLVNDRLSEH